MSERELCDKLEALIDGASVRLVCEALAQVCSEKADHIRENWQDRGLAKLWDHDAERLQLCADAVEC